jgi:hypothetical protein
MSEPPVVHMAARNNAEWCDAFCRTYGIAGRFRANSWSSPVRTPPHYPDAVTLLPEAEVAQLLSGIDTSEGCSVKDSFADLDLTAAGFRPLFRAEWLHRASGNGRGVSCRRWSTVTNEQQLGEWESTWAGSPEASGFFRPAVLVDEAIAVLARYDDGRIVAGAVANRSATVIGLSNVFDAAGNLESAWLGGAAAAKALWGQMPVVGYDSGASLDAAHQAGFDSIGELVVWLKAPSSL